MEDGYVTLPELPGLGFEGKSKLIKVMRELADNRHGEWRRSGPWFVAIVKSVSSSPLKP